jgi:ATP-dependent RNA helicase DHX37/DHR1
MAQNFLTGVSAIQSSWLPNLGKTLTTITKELDDPAPYYDAQRDKLMCYARPIYGPQRWELPVQEVEFPDCQNAYKWFVRFLLEGAVISGFVAIKVYTTTTTTTGCIAWC